MKRILRGQAKAYAFDRSLPPKLRVNPGEKFILENEDAASGYLREEGQSPLNRPFIDENLAPFRQSSGRADLCRGRASGRPAGRPN